MICRHPLRLRYLWLYQEGDQVWNPLAVEFVPRSAYVEAFKPKFIETFCTAAWQKGYRKAHIPIHREDKAGSENTTSVFYRGLVEAKNDALGLDRGQLCSLF